jgi:thiol-disulfide isomerase/thioredoxin
MKRLLKAVAIGCLSVQCVCAQLPEKYIGNWIQSSTNTWEYGFFERFAIYRNAFWDYRSTGVDANGNAVVVLSSGNERVPLTLRLTPKGELSVRKGTQAAQTCVPMTKVYPDYPHRDTSFFRTPSFRTDTVTLIGYFRHLERIPAKWVTQFAKQPFKVTVPNVLSGEEDAYTASMDDQGRFTLRFPVTDMQAVYVDWSRLHRYAAVEAGDTLLLFADLLDFIPLDSDGSYEGYYQRPKQLLFMGDNARVNNELATYVPSTLYCDSRRGATGSDVAYLTYCDSVYRVRMNVFNAYVQGHPMVSEKCRAFVSEGERCELLFDLMQHRFDARRRGKPDMEPAYVDFVRKTAPLNTEWLYAGFREFRNFLRDWMGYHESISPTRSLEVDSMLTNESLRRLWRAQTYYSRMDHSHLPLSASELSAMKEAVVVPSLVEPLMNLHRRYESVGKSEMAYPESLKHTEALAGITDANALFEALIKPYRGNVIYVDFWGTWCGPCKENMRYAKGLKEKLNGTKVVFMYFANNSPENSWKSIIKEMNLTGENVVHYRLPDAQEALLERLLSVKQFPTYLIVNKEGKVVNADAKSPMRGEETLKQIIDTF